MLYDRVVYYVFTQTNNKRRHQPDGSFSQERPGDGMLLGAEVAAVSEVYGAELGKRELLQVARQLHALLFCVHVSCHLDMTIWF